MNNTLNTKRGLNLIKSWLKPSYVLLSIFLFTLGVGQMWADSTVKGGDIYFDPAQSNWGTPTSVEYIISHDSYSCWYAMSSVTNTKLYYISSASWGDAKYIAFTANAGWTSCEGNSYDSRKRYLPSGNKHTAKSTYGVNSGSVYLFYAANANDDAAITTSSPAGYKSGGVTDLNSTQTVKFAISENGGTPAELSSGTTPSKIRMRSYKFVSGTNGSVSAESPSDWAAGSSTYNKTFTAARTATTTVTVSNEVDGYTFLGWYSAASGGTQLSLNKEYTYYPTAATTVYARFSHETTHTVDITYVCASPSTTVSTATSQAIGQVTASSITAPTVAGYTFSNWTLGTGISNQSANTSANPISVKTLSSGTYTMQANYTEDLSSDWHLLGASTPFGGWESANSNMLQKASGSSTGSVASIEINVSALPSAEEYTFKLYNATTDKWRTNGGYWVTRANNNPTLSTEGGTDNELIFKPDIVGNYVFTLNYSSADPVLTVTFPTIYSLTYDIGTVKGNNGSISTSPTTASGSNVISGANITLTAPAAKTGYTWKGWYTNAAGTEGQIADVDRAITVTMNADKTLYACYTENTYNVKATASTGGSVTPTSNTSMGQVTGGDITATPSAGYSFTNWTISSGSGYFGASGTATTSTTANTKFRPTAATTLLGTFSEIMRTVSVDVNNSYLGSVSVASLTDVGPATESAEVTATAETGASFSSWTLPSGVTAAAGYSTSSNPIKVNATAASKTITANFTEAKHSVTLTNDNSSQGTVNTSSPVSVGQITAVQIQATAKTNYMFSGWVKTAGSGTVTYYTGAGNGQLVDETGATKATTYICVTGDVTLKATWEEDRSSGYVIYYGNDGKNADGGEDMSQERAWKEGVLNKPTIAESNTSTFVFTAGVADVDKVIEFKVHQLSPSTWYGYGSASGGKITGNISDVTLNTAYGNGRICITMPGNYTFTWDKSTNQLSLSYPTNVYYLRGGFNSWLWSHPMTETSSGVYAATVNMTEANHTYSGDNGFKLLIAGQYYGKNSTTVTRSTSTGSSAISGCGTSGANIGITTDYTGNYTFTYTVASNTLQVTYPTAYKVTYGKGSVNGSASNCSAVDIDNSNASVTSNSTWVKSGNRVVLTAPAAKSGYTYDGWFNNNSGTGAAITTNANCTITVSSAETYYACYHENKTAITITTDGHGTITTPNPNNSPYNLGVTTTQAINASPNTGYSWNRWTISGNAALGSSATTQSNTAKGNGTAGGSGTITATFTAKTYDVILDVNGGSGDNQTVTATFDAAMPTTLKGGSDPIAARTRTGYNFGGYSANNDGTGTQYYTSALASNHIWDVATNNTHIYAMWTAKSCDITLDYQTGATGYASSGSISNTVGLTATYSSAMTALTGTMPSAANGYAFMGFYSETNGNGTKYYNADGSSATTWAEDTESATTLYAYYKKAVITSITFSPSSTVAPNETLTVTANVDPEPTGTTIVCWRVLHSNDNPLETQPTFSPTSGATVSFTVPATSGTYKIEATLRTGTTCGAGTELSTQKMLFQVAGDHTVTVLYKDASGNTIQASSSVTGRPLVWSSVITPPSIFGYTFNHWEARDGVTISTNGTSAIDGSTTTTSSIYIKAIYNGSLTAVYNQNDIIYFKNTLNWSSVYVNFHTADYWNSSTGSGNNGVTHRNKAMTRIGETDIWYYDYGVAGITPSHYVSFTEDEQEDGSHGYEHFWKSGTGENVSYPARRADDLADKSGAIGFYAKTPMFVPLASQAPVVKNNSGGGKANYYNDGYWTKYIPGTGYTVEIYNNYDASPMVKSVALSSGDELMPMAAVIDLEGNKTYRFQLKRDGDVYYGNTGTMTYTDHGQNTAWEMSNEATRRNDANNADVFSMCRITTTAAGNYTFHLYYSPNNSKQQYRLRMEVDYPIKDGDYRVIYKDNVHTAWHPSAIVSQVNNGKDTVSFFIRPGQTPVMKIQQASVASGGAITWNDYSTISSRIDNNDADGYALPRDSVYNICLTMDGSGDISVENVEAYTGNFYIRTDGANSKWDNYRSDSKHIMTYSEYSEQNSDFTHYWMVHLYPGTNVKFVVANDYSPCISDTLIQGTYKGISDATWVDAVGNLSAQANIRFMWHRHNNAVKRAYLSPAKENGSHYLVLRGQENELLSESGTALESSNNHGVENNSIQFSDDENWIYETTVQSVPSSYVKLYARYQGSDIYYKGDSGDNFNNSDDDSDGIPNAIQLVTGSGSALRIRVIYDFKTDRLVAAYLPSGEISTEMDINADVMFIREHQGDIEQVTFKSSGAITDIKTAYAVMRFNKWTLNNKNKEGEHTPLASPVSRFERDLFYVSFPFRVNLNEVFGFGQYGKHWIMEEYDGAGRAAKGFWQDSPTFWKFITNRQGKYLEPNVGYLLALDLDELGESSSVWNNDVEDVELFFPSTGSMDDITSSSRTYELPEHTCTIVRNGSDRRIADSHWNIMSVPTYVNTNNVEFANTLWSTGDKDPDAGKLGPNFLYTWNPDDNSLTATTARGFTYHAMHAYTVQYCGNVKWTSSVSVTPSPIVARQQTAPAEYEWCLELQQNETMLDRTYVRMSNEEEVTTGFEFGYDMSKDLNKNKANIYSFITTAESTEMIAGNSMPMETEQTTLVPLGIVIATTGDYTFAMPDGTNGVGVTLVDNVTNERTSLSALDYTVNLTAGDYTNRFWLEISPVPEVPTDIPSTGAGIEGKAQKKLIDGILYIVRDGKMYDARGARLH